MNKKLFLVVIFIPIIIGIITYIAIENIYKDNEIITLTSKQEYKKELLLPSIKSLPPHDIQIAKEDRKYMLRFSATHANIGDAPLEIISAPIPNGTRDEEREVFQKILRKDGGIETKSIGFFMWHTEHDHYHLTDFMEYSLTPLDTPTTKPVFQKKITYCLRDNDPFDTTLPGAPKEKTYTKCGPESQGISVGWSGTYGYQLPGQNIDVTDLPSGRYELKIIFDPLGVIQERDRNDNIASKIIVIDSKKRTVSVEGFE